MKILMLIISSDTEPVYEKHREIWRSYMNSTNEIEAYFIQYRDGIQEVEENTFWLSGTESFKGIITKTLDSMDFFLKQKEYDFVIRTNLSSLWNFKVLLEYIKTLNKQNVYNGFVGYDNNVQFVSGSGFIMSNDVAKKLIDNRLAAESYNALDDVSIAYVLTRICNIPITNGHRNDSLIYNPHSYHYRLKMHDREQEVIVMNKILKEIMNNI